jgi:hypothetical protein
LSSILLKEVKGEKMIPKKHLKGLGTFATVAVAILLVTVACSSSAPGTRQSTLQISEITTTPTSIWYALHQRTPYPYSTPLPPPTPTILDGTYSKFELKEATPVPCKRCPDYAPEGGIWKLSLDKGIFRIFYAVTGWRSIGSFTIAGNQLVLFNDPNCPEVVGTYTWKLERENLTLKVIKDECAIGLRAMNLTNLPWLSCHPPSTEAAITDHWPKPRGCD